VQYTSNESASFFIVAFAVLVRGPRNITLTSFLGQS
ncbi:uncharacterized protein METZ01_LOCUS405148, partial [marine metagenome]